MRLERMKQMIEDIKVGHVRYLVKGLSRASVPSCEERGAGTLTPRHSAVIVAWSMLHNLSGAVLLKRENC